MNRIVSAVIAALVVIFGVFMPRRVGQGSRLSPGFRMWRSLIWLVWPGLLLIKLGSKKGDVRKRSDCDHVSAALKAPERTRGSREEGVRTARSRSAVETHGGVRSRSGLNPTREASG